MVLFEVIPVPLPGNAMKRPERITRR